MDPEKLDDQTLDALHDEVAAMVRRHGADPAHGEEAEWGRGRGVNVLALVEPDGDLEQRILDATAAVQRGAPWHRKVLRGLAWAGSHAMRPQLAMAAVFVLVVGSSLLLLRAKPGTGVAPLRVTERGVPAPEQAAQAPASTAIAAAEPEADLQETRRGRSAGEGGALAKAEKNDSKEKQAESEDDKDGGAAALLASARQARDTAGCAAAVGPYDRVGAQFPGSKEASLAMWEAAACYESMGQPHKAVELWLALRADESYRDQADAQIAQVEGKAQNLGSAPGAGAGVAAPAKKAASPAPAPAEDAAEAAPPESPPAQGGSGDAPAGPDRSFDQSF